MRQIFILLFGREAHNIYSTTVDGVEWYPAVQLCRLLGDIDVSSAMKDRWGYYNLLDGEKRKFLDKNFNIRSEVWFVTERGFWKLLGISQSTRAMRFKCLMLTEYLPLILHNEVNNTDILYRLRSNLF